MNKNVLIKLENIQKIIEADQLEKINRKFKGELYQKKDKFYLSYDDNSEGIGGARTLIKIDPVKERVLLLRHHPAAMKQDFIIGEKKAGYFKTSYGEIEISVKTNTIEMNIDDQTGIIEVNYQVFLGGELNAKHHLKLTYKTLKG